MIPTAEPAYWFGVATGALAFVPVLLAAAVVLGLVDRARARRQARAAADTPGTAGWQLVDGDLG